MNPANISRVKRIMRKVEFSDVRQILDKLMPLATADEVSITLEKEMQQRFPQIFTEAHF